ncbi:MAG: hypothetical protein ACHREM_31840 [Polyangiales bacterium]
MAGEFVRTPKKGSDDQRYKSHIKIPYAEFALSMVSFGSTLAALENGHWFAAPFAGLFCFGYGYVAVMLMTEQVERRRAARTSMAGDLAS